MFTSDDAGTVKKICFYPVLQSLLRRFIKRELLTDATPQRLVRLDVTDKQSRVPPKAVDIGIGAETAVKVFLK